MGDDSGAWPNQRGDDLRPVVMDKNGKDIYENISALSVKDLEHIDQICVPVYAQDAYHRQNMDESIYFFNKTGRSTKVMGTTDRVDRAGQDTRDPDNYSMMIDQNLQEGSFFKVKVNNTIWVAWEFQSPGNRYREGGETFPVSEPNGSVLTFRITNGSVEPHVTRNESRSPHALFLENRAQNTTIKISIYIEDPEEFPPSKYQKPAYEAVIKHREHQEYTHLIMYRFWLVDWFKPVAQVVLDDSSVPSFNNIAQGAETKDFRTGTISWWSCVKNVSAGKYVLLVTNPSEQQAKFVFAVYDWEAVSIVPKQQYIRTQI